MDVQFAKLRECLPIQEQVSDQLEYLKAQAQEPKSLAWILFCTISLFYFVYWTGQVIYRLTFHPLARFPGPFLCKIGHLKQGYYEAFLNGMFIHQIVKYHRKYDKSFPIVLLLLYSVKCLHSLTLKSGSIVRINPNEVHIDDSSIYHE